MIFPLIEEHTKQNISFTVAYLTGPETLKLEINNLGAETVLLGTNLFKALKKLRKIISDQENPVSIIHTHNVQASLLGRLAGYLNKIPVITTRHNLTRGKKYNLFHVLEDYTSRFSTAVVAISTAVRDHLIHSHFVEPPKCYTVYNPIDLRLFESSPLIGIEQRKNIVCNARFIKLKGLEYLLDAFQSIGHLIPESKLVLIGRYESQSDIIHNIKNHIYSERIVLSGFIPREDIMDELSNARVYVQPSLTEGLGLSAIEAMGSMCPCIFSNVGGLIELAQDPKNALLFKSMDSEDLAKKIIYLWENLDVSKELAINAKTFVYDCFGSERIAQQYLDVYNDVLRI